MDKFEKYIRNEREAFDADEPNEQVWERISASLDAKQQANKRVRLVPITRIWQMAAVFTGLIVCMIAFQVYYNSKNNKIIANNKSHIETIALENINPELAEAEQFYFTQIEQKSQEVKKFYSEGIKTDSEADKYMRELDVAYKELKKELSTNSNELVISEMVRNLQIRIDLLNQQLEVLKEIEKIKEAKKGKNL